MMDDSLHARKQPSQDREKLGDNDRLQLGEKNSLAKRVSVEWNQMDPDGSIWFHLAHYIWYTVYIILSSTTNTPKL